MAGRHVLHVTIDRLWRDEGEVYGTISIDGAPRATVTILPAIKKIWPSRTVRTVRRERPEPDRRGVAMLGRCSERCVGSLST